MLAQFLKHYHALSDRDFIWFPFQRLRPRPNETIGWGRLLIMTCCFGLYGPLIWPIKQWLTDGSMSIASWLDFTLKSFVIFGVWFSVVTRPLWNQRARQLSNEDT